MSNRNKYSYLSAYEAMHLIDRLQELQDRLWRTYEPDLVELCIAEFDAPPDDLIDPQEEDYTL